MRATQKAKAMMGLDYVREDGWNATQRTRAGWKRYADRLAREQSQRDKFTWTATVTWIHDRDCYRINFGGMKT